MPLYTRFEAVRLRLIGKVRFAEDAAEDDNVMSIALAKRLINEAEGQVEQDLSPRYEAPFQTVDGEPFAQLPIRPTQEIISTLCELQSVVRILETDFGRGSATDSDKYTKNLRARYTEIVDKRVLALKDDSYQNWKFPPLPGMKLAIFNRAADDGYAGTLMKVDGGGGFAAQQINSPGETFWNVCDTDVDALL